MTEAACLWWALCDNEATQTRPHPVLGDVPICDRCQAKCEEIEPPDQPMRYAVDVPNGHDPEAEWVNYGYYPTREEALEAVRHHFGADEAGRIELISELPVEEDEV
jgi:hypothetical protein